MNGDGVMNEVAFDFSSYITYSDSQDKLLSKVLHALIDVRSY